MRSALIEYASAARRSCSSSSTACRGLDSNLGHARRTRDRLRRSRGSCCCCRRWQGMRPPSRSRSLSAQKQSGAANGYPAGTRKRIVVEALLQPAASGTEPIVTRIAPPGRACVRKSA